MFDGNGGVAGIYADSTSQAFTSGRLTTEVSFTAQPTNRNVVLLYSENQGDIFEMGLTPDGDGYLDINGSIYIIYGFDLSDGSCHTISYTISNNEISAFIDGTFIIDFSAPINHFIANKESFYVGQTYK